MPTKISSTELTFADNTSQSSAFPLTGSILMWPSGVSIPSGYLPCDGTPLNAETDTKYSDLYDVISIIYGGTGKSYFKLPNLTDNNNGLTPIGSSTMPSNTITVDNTPTNKGGSNKLTNTNIIHKHTFSRAGFMSGMGGTRADNGNSTSYGPGNLTNSLTTYNPPETQTPSDFYPPFQNVMFIIKY